MRWQASRSTVDDYVLQRREQAVPSGWTRVTTTVVLRGGGDQGEGEDVTYTPDDHDGFPAGSGSPAAGRSTSFSQRVDELELWREEPRSPPRATTGAGRSRARRSTSALRQAGRSLGELVGRTYRPVRFVVSTRADVEPYLELYPELEFKLDVEEDWDRALMARLAALDRVRVLDLKAYYRGTSVDLAPDPALYRAVAEAFPDAVIEDAWLEDGCREALRRRRGPAELRRARPLARRPRRACRSQPRWLNVKPSRFGTVRGLLECIDACEERGIRMYGGGQFELGAGRRADPAAREPLLRRRPERRGAVGLQRGRRAPGLPTSPLPAPEGVGLRQSLRRAARPSSPGPATRTASAGSALCSARRCGAGRCTSSRRASASARTTGTSAKRSGCSSSPARRRCGRRTASACCVPGTSRCSARGPDGAHEVRNDTDEVARVVMLSTLCDPEICVYPDSGKIGARQAGRAPTVPLIGLRNRPEANLDYFDGEP